MSSGNPEQERALAMMREIYKQSGQNFKTHELDKLIADAEWEIKKWAAYAAEEVALAVAAERAECAKFICKNCAIGNKLERSANGLWWHGLVQCHAAAIHERGGR